MCNLNLFSKSYIHNKCYMPNTLHALVLHKGAQDIFIYNTRIFSAKFHLRLFVLYESLKQCVNLPKQDAVCTRVYWGNRVCFLSALWGSCNHVTIVDNLQEEPLVVQVLTCTTFIKKKMLHLLWSLNNFNEEYCMNVLPF